MKNLDGAMYVPGPSKLVAEVIQDRWNVIIENPLSALLPKTTQLAYVGPLAQMLHEQLEIKKGSKSILSPGFQATVARIEGQWQVSINVRQQLERHLRSQIYQRWPIREERIAVIHAFLYWIFLDDNGAAIMPMMQRCQETPP